MDGFKKKVTAGLRYVINIILNQIKTIVKGVLSCLLK